uniref:Kinetochore protein Nuf2 N-terminal domain-containing protein n=1 Tax=Proboscia inermis TaxID=420281 RepID=A0A7S0CD28_9STRA
MMDVTHNQTYSFPLLKNAEILTSMSDLGISICENELLEPHRHKDAIRHVFLGLIESGMGLTKQHLATPNDDAKKFIESLPFPDLHVDSAGELKFIKCSMKLMKSCGIHDFGIKDLHAPTAKRLRRQLSAAINLMRYKEDKINVYTMLHEEREKLIADLQQVQEENEMLNQQFEETKVESANEWNAIEEVENECEEIESEIAVQNKLQASIRQESGLLKKKANDLKDKIATISLAIQDAESEERKLATGIVKSPQRIKTDMAGITKTLEIEREECQKAKREALAGRQSIANITKAKEDVIQATYLMEEVSGERSKHKSVIDEVDVAKCSIEGNEKKIREFESRSKECVREIDFLEKEAISIRKQSEIKLNEQRQAYHDAGLSLAAVEKGRKEQLARMDAHEVELKELEEARSKERLEMELEIKNMVQAYKDMEKIVLRKDRQLMESLEIY